MMVSCFSLLVDLKIAPWGGGGGGRTPTEGGGGVGELDFHAGPLIYGQFCRLDCKFAGNNECLSTQCFGTPSKVSEISKWLALKRSLRFAKAEAKLKRRCGAVTPFVLSDVERLLRQTQGLFGMNGHCTVANLKVLLGNHGLTTSGPKVELVQWVCNNITRIRESQGLQYEEAISMLEEDGPNDEEDVEDDLICFVCLTGDVSEGILSFGALHGRWK